MFPPIDVPCLLGPPDRGTKKNEKQKKYVRTLSAEAPSSKTSGCFLFFCFFGDPRFPNLWKFVVFCIYEYSKHLVISEMSLSGAKFPEVWEFGGSKKPVVSTKNKKKKKHKKKTQLSRGLCTWGFCRKSFEILFFLVVCCFYFFVFFGFLETPGFLEPPNSQTSGKLHFLVFLNTQNIWSYLKCLYLLQKLQKNICKSLSLSGAKFPEKNICKAMENRTLRDTRSVF